MKNNPRKLQMLLCLEKFDNSVSLPELVAALGENFPERSVRRWLAEYAQFGVVEKTGRKRSTRYRLTAKGVYTGAVMRIEGHQTATFEQYAPTALALFHRPLNKRLKADYHGQVLEQYHPNRTNYLTPEQLEHLEQVGFRGKPADDEGAYAKATQQQWQPALIYNSVRLEDIRLSMALVTQLMGQADVSDMAIDSTTVSVLNHIEATNYLAENADTLDIDVTGICTLHFLLSDALVAAAHAGKVRDKGLLLPYSTYIPPSDPLKIQRLLGNICAKAMHIDNPFEQSLFLLIQLSYLQPFIAVNRRAARLCANIPLVRDNYVPMTFAGVKNQQYDAATLALLEQHDPNPLVQLFYHSYLAQCKDYDSTLEQPDFDHIRLKYRTHIRQLIHLVVSQKQNAQVMAKAIVDYSNSHIPLQDQGAFEQLMAAEFKQLSPQRIAGTGLSRKALNDWLALE